MDLNTVSKIKELVNVLNTKDFSSDLSNLSGVDKAFLKEFNGF
jgi:hypothetical protein